MKFLALVSGGKDSCFNIMHCLNQGHELVGMVNFRPKAGRPEEIDSYMFQTVGFKTVEYIAQCSDVPLFTAEISENEEAVVQEMASMFTKIRQTLDFEGVSAGAIASTYQQSRVDKACILANLQPLTYLWQRDQADLLHEIVNSGLDARVIKVAGMGLNSSHLGRSLGSLEPELLQLNNECGLHPCGEGGEYETMVLNAPFFNTHKLEFVDPKCIQHSVDDVFYLEFDVQMVEKKEESTSKLLVPSLLDDLPPKPVSTKLEFKGKNSKTPKYQVIKSATDCLPNVLQVWGSENPGKSARGHTCVAIGETCSYLTGEIDPSARVIDVLGTSFWVPATFPYAQAQLSFGISYLSGQRGLVPTTSSLPKDIELECRLGLQHCVRILNLAHELASNWSPRLGIVYLNSSKQVGLANQVWKEFTNVPLIAVVLQNKSPLNGSSFMWQIQACDHRYLQFFLPEDEEDDDFYSEVPEMQLTKTGYIHRAAFHFLNVSTAPIESKFVVLKESKRMEAHVVLGDVYYESELVDGIYIDF